MPAVLVFLKMGKIMLVCSNYAQNYVSTIYKSLGGGGGEGEWGKQQGLRPRNDVITTCKAIRWAAVLRKGGKIFRCN